MTPADLSGRDIQRMVLSPDGRLVAAQGVDFNDPHFSQSTGALPGHFRCPAPGGGPHSFWSADGHTLYAYRRGSCRARIFKIDLTTGRREFWKEIAPADRTGVAQIGHVVMSPDTLAIHLQLPRVFWPACSRRGIALSLATGTRLGFYEILGPIGAGGMGEVWRARDTRLGRDVAIKVLPPSFSADPDRLARFEREARAVAALSHPNILAIHDFGTHDGVTYAAMELLEGETLGQILSAGPLSARRATDLALQIARPRGRAREGNRPSGPQAREHLRHERRAGEDPRFRSGPAGDDRANTSESSPTVSALTEPGTVLGTVGYMSPEQVRGLPLDARTDIFSFGRCCTRCSRARFSAGDRRRDDDRDPPGRSAGALGDGPSRIPGPGADRAALSGEAARIAIPVRAGPRVRARVRLGPVGPDGRRGDRRSRSPSDRAAALDSRRRARGCRGGAGGGRRANARCPRDPRPFDSRSRLPRTRASRGWWRSLPTAAGWRSPRRGRTAAPRSGFVRSTPSSRAHSMEPTARRSLLVAGRPRDRLLRAGEAEEGRGVRRNAADALQRAGRSRGHVEPSGTILFSAFAGGEIDRVPESGGSPSPLAHLVSHSAQLYRWPSFLPDGRHFFFALPGREGPGNPRRGRRLRRGVADRGGRRRSRLRRSRFHPLSRREPSS